VALDLGGGASSETVPGVVGGHAADAEPPLDAAPGGSSVGAVIAAILPRRTTFRRSTGSPNRRGEARLADEQVMAANVDVALLVAGLDDDFNLRRMERYLAVSAACQIRAVVVLNKSDIGRDQDERVLAIREIAPTVRIVAVSARSGSGMTELSDVLVPGTTAVILGSSGVGKSTLVNALLGEDRQATGEVRESDSRGRHTTTHRELFVLPTGALLIDTPGIRALEVLGAEEGVDDTFADVDEIAAGCRFGNCRHNGEPGCQIAVALADGRLTPERLASYTKLEREAAHTARAVDPRARAEEQRRWKLIHKAVSRHMDTKYGADR
jgi:ribosome biogenesis GTPase